MEDYDASAYLHSVQDEPYLCQMFEWMSSV